MNKRTKDKSCLQIVYQTYQDFAANTSIHGLKYTIKSDIRLTEKLFWYIVVLSGLITAMFMTYLFWVRYTSNPTRTTILTTYAPSTTIPFPTVTICNVNRILQNKVDQFVNKLTLRDNETEIVKRALPMLTAFSYPDGVAFNEPDLKVLQSVLERNDYSDVVLVMRKITQSCDELLVKCKWENREFNCMELFEYSFTVDGLCCSFNYVDRSEKVKLKYSSYFGTDSGLQLLLNPMVQPVQYSKYSSIGAKVSIHNAGDYPGEAIISRVVSVGELSWFQINAERLMFSKAVQNLPIDQRDCLYPNEGKMEFFNSGYADSNCLVECDIKMFHLNCGCVPYYYGIQGFTVCNVTSIPCLKETHEDLHHKECLCRAECEDEFYSIFFTSTNIISNYSLYTTTMFSGDLVNNNSIIVKLYFASGRQKILYRDSITSTTYLLSSFGGVYSLFMGCSLMTIVEIVYYSIIRFIVNMKLFKNEINKPIKEEIKISTSATSTNTFYGFHQFIN